MSKTARINMLIKESGELSIQLNNLAQDLFDMYTDGYIDVHKQVLYDQLNKQYWSMRDQIAYLSA